MICAEIWFPQVQKEFSVYEALLGQSKIAEEHPVALTQKAAGVEFIGNSRVALGWTDFHCEFEAAKSPKSTIKYGLKLFAGYFSEKPCFRFCSRGSPHVNEEMGDGLPARAVPTPHFHRVDSGGILYAYQPDPLLNPVERDQILSNPQLGANLFCQEANLFSPNGGFVVVKIMATEFDLSTDDPLNGATFPP